MQGGSRAWRGVRAAGHGLFYATMGGVFLVLLVIGLITFADRDLPTYWGAFTETSTTCDPPGPRSTCLSKGTWVSDDGSIVKDDINLDGSVGQGETVRAAYHPGGFMGDDVNNIVHVGIWAHAGLWMPWVMLAGFGAITWTQYRDWGRAAAYTPRHRAGGS